MPCSQEQTEAGLHSSAQKGLRGSSDLNGLMGTGSQKGPEAPEGWTQPAECLEQYLGKAPRWQIGLESSYHLLAAPGQCALGGFSL